MTTFYTKEQIDSMGGKIGAELKKAKEEVKPKNAKDNTPLAFWVGTQLEYDAILTKNPNTLYMVRE